jgi:hypothetical protein
MINEQCERTIGKARLYNLRKYVTKKEIGRYLLLTKMQVKFSCEK